ncbi:MAG: sensor histidine kinase [Candidatus Wallbacteria bacterium]|nr:sensor histidine kinase [Candidatus Wallbacteria bacterium]
MIESKKSSEKSSDGQKSELASVRLQLNREISQRECLQKNLVDLRKNYTRALNETLMQKNQLRHLTHKLLRSVEDERKRISRELHDDIAQILAGINIQLAALTLEAGINNKSFTSKIARTRRLVEKSVNIVHRFATELRPPALDDLGLIRSIKAYLNAFGRQSDIKVHFSQFPEADGLKTSSQIILYRVMQSALANVTKHAHAGKVILSLKNQSGMIQMDITDDGRGFDVEHVVPSKTRRLGLLGMRERVEMAGGKLTVTSAPGQGTTIKAAVPFILQVKHPIPA